MGDKQKRYSLVEMNSIKDVDVSDVFATSEDGKTIVTNDGLKVSDDLINQAKTDQKARAAGAAAVQSAPAGVSREELQDVVDNAVKKALSGKSKSA
jgi:hypothetical protein